MGRMSSVFKLASHSASPGFSTWALVTVQRSARHPDKALSPVTRITVSTPSHGVGGMGGMVARRVVRDGRIRLLLGIAA